MNLFREWMSHMGFNGKQMTQAATLLGIGPGRTQALSAGSKPSSSTELLAMSALAAGLPEWSPETHEDFLRVRAVLDLINNSNRKDQTDETA